LGPDVSDVDGNVETRKGTISLFNGPPPMIMVLNSAEEEGRTVGGWLTARTREGVKPHEIGVFVRSAAELDRARSAVRSAGLVMKVLDEHVDTDLEEVYTTERHLLYVSCTRARDHLLVTGVAPASEFLDDLRK
jgi:superfamily I DNA/RNA helicase